MFKGKPLLTGVAVAGVLLSSCHRDGGNSTRVTLKTPSNENLAAGSNWPDPDKVCFAFDVRGPGISDVSYGEGLCHIAMGETSDWGSSGSSLTLDVPRGADRSLRLFAFLKIGNTCPKMNVFRTAAAPFQKTYLVAFVEGLNTSAEETTLVLTPTFPGSGTVSSFLGWPNPCNRPNDIGIKRARFIIGQGQVTTSSGQVVVNVSEGTAK